MLHLKKIAYHRNGVFGAPFHVVLFKDGEDAMLGVTFDTEKGSRDIYTAVFDVAKLAAGDIEFGSNSYRGDVFHDTIKGWIKKYEADWDAKVEAGVAWLLEGRKASDIRDGRTKAA
jgi:hypothetical protein